MTQQVINLDTVLNEGVDGLQISFEKSNRNFTELYKGAGSSTGGIWNFDATSTDTITPPVSGRFKTNSGNYRDATQLAIHAITIQSVDRAFLLRTLLPGDIIQCQDASDADAWCRYILQSASVDNGTWFQLNVAIEADGGVASGNNQEIIFTFTAVAGGGGGGGEPGPAGPPGPEGPPGPQGDLGPAGADGSPGPKGDTGDTGPQGPQGDTGATGAAGATGAQGPPGTAGIQGPQGEPGPTGSTGAQGPAGADGAPGATGSQGPKGDKGDTGSTGPAGVVTANAPLSLVGSTLSIDLTAYATNASPTFTGDPKAPTPTAGDNDTSIATTAFVTAAVAAAGSGAATPGPPQGRLTLQSAIPVMTTTQSAKTSIYYTPYVGAMIPIFDGTKFGMTVFTEISVATTDTTKNPAAIGASKVNDWFVWNDAGTLRLTHGPDWTNDTARSAGTVLNYIFGFWTNSVAITNGPATNRGTYVGTTRSNASSTLDWIYGGLAAGGTAGFFGVANAYNQVEVRTLVSDSTDSWTYGTAAWRASNAAGTGSGLNMRVSYLDPFGTATVAARNYGYISHASGFAVGGIGVDTTTAFSGTTATVGAGIGTPACAEYAGVPGLGFHFVQAIEYATAGAAGTFRGDNGTPAFLQTGLWFGFKA